MSDYDKSNPSHQKGMQGQGQSYGQNQGKQSLNKNEADDFKKEGHGKGLEGAHGAKQASSAGENEKEGFKNR